jgi:hypothetical protein
MKKMQPGVSASQPKFGVGDTCTFTNKGSSGYKGNDGKECSIVRVKNPDECVNKKVSEYIIRFADGNGFGASERELKLKTQKQ